MTAHARNGDRILRVLSLRLPLGALGLLATAPLATQERVETIAADIICAEEKAEMLGQSR